MSKKIAVIISILLLSSLIISTGCTKPSETVVPVPPSETWDWDPSEGDIVGSEFAAYFPRGGAYTSTGRTLTLSWSAEGNVKVFILSQKQFSDFASGFEAGSTKTPSAYEATGTRASGTIKFIVKDTNVYYGLIASAAVGNSPVKLNWAKLTQQ